MWCFVFVKLLKKFREKSLSAFRVCLSERGCKIGDKLLLLGVEVLGCLDHNSQDKVAFAAGIYVGYASTLEGKACSALRAFGNLIFFGFPAKHRDFNFSAQSRFSTALAYAGS